MSYQFKWSTEIELLSPVECVDEVTEVHFNCISADQEEVSIENGEQKTPGCELLSKLEQLDIGGIAYEHAKLMAGDSVFLYFCFQG